jgi:hypothetical protein
MFKRFKDFLDQMVCDPTTEKASMGRIAFWAMLTASLFHYTAITAEWSGLLLGVLAYCYGSKKSTAAAAGGEGA